MALETRVINLTPHEVTICDGSANVILRIPPDGREARVSAQTVTTGYMPDLNIPITATQYGDVTGLPDPEDNVYYVVSSLVAQRCRDRQDVLIPNQSVRDDKGRIIGCRSLGQI